MRKLILLGLLLLWITPVYAQGDDGCADPFLELIGDELPEYLEVCDAYVTDDVELIDLALERTAACEDETCVGAEMLMLALIDMPRLSAFEYYENQEEIYSLIISNGPGVVNAVREGDLDTAKMLYQQILDTSYDNPMLLYSMGLLHQLSGDTETALEMYQSTVELHYYNPLLFLSRASLYESIDEPVLATLDYLSAQQFTQTELPIDSLSTPQDFVYYPMVSKSFGIVGTQEFWLGAEEPQPVQLILDAPEHVIYYPNVEAGIGGLPILPAAIVVPMVGEGEYAVALNDAWANASFNISVTEDESGNFEVSTSLYYFEGGSQITGVIAAAAAADPRESVEILCEGAPPSRLVAGDEVYPSNRADGLALYVLLDADAEPDRVISPFWETIVLSGEPLCMDGIIWWSVTIPEDSRVLYIRENRDATTYDLIKTE